MFYTQIENLKSRFHHLFHHEEDFIPAGTVPIQEAKTSFSFSNLKSFGFRNLDFPAKRLLVLISILIVSAVSLNILSSNYSSFLSQRNAALAEEAATRAERSSSQNSSSNSSSSNSTSSNPLTSSSSTSSSREEENPDLPWNSYLEDTYSPSEP